MAPYIWPFGVHTASDADGSFTGHTRRTPPSVNPGTDFPVKRGTPVLAPANGTIVEADNDPNGSGGRMLGLNCDDGHGFDFLHLSSLVVTRGAVKQGDVIAYSGGSAYGSESGVADHCHVSFRPNWRHYLNAGNMDFVAFMGGAPAGPSISTDTLWDQQRLNVWAAKDGAERLVEDGVRGPKTIARITDFQIKHGLEPDGIAGPITDAKLSLNPGANLMVDGVWGPATTTQLQLALGVTPDGRFGPQSTKALQAKIGAKVDGDFGPQTKRALQSWLRVAQDGDIGPVTVRALQTRLNAGTF